MPTIHIVDGKANPPEALVWRALCGEGCITHEDGTLTPEDFDFVLLGKGHEKATCVECRDRTLPTIRLDTYAELPDVWKKLIKEANDEMVAAGIFLTNEDLYGK